MLEVYQTAKVLGGPIVVSSVRFMICNKLSVCEENLNNESVFDGSDI